jgi:hypothetical protein
LRIALIAVLVAASLMLAAIVCFLATVALSLFKPTAHDGYAVSAATCEVDRGGILLQLTVTPTEASTHFQVEQLPAGDVSVLGVAALPAGLALGTLSASELQELRETIAEGARSADLDHDASNVVIGLLKSDRSIDRPVRLDRVQLWWVSGEPTFTQDVWIGLQSNDDSCSVSLAER